jgi:hypothetical protein
MRETVRKLSIMAGALCFMLAGVVFGEITGSAQTISVGSNWTTGHRSKGDADLLHQYQFTVPKDGKVTVTCKSVEKDWTIYLKNADCTERYNYAAGGNSASFSEYVKAGTYGIFFGADYNSWEGDYQFKVEFTPVDCDVPEPNNDFLSATPITLDQVKKGLLTDTNREDYFKIDLKTATSLQISTAGQESRSVYIYDSNYVEKYRNSYSGNYTTEKYLAAGTYYIQIHGYADEGSPYTIKCSAVQYITGINLRGPIAIITRGKSMNLLASITPSDASQKTLQWSSNDRGVAAVSGNGTVTGKGIGYTTISASSMDGSNKSQSTTVVVKPAKIAMKSVKLTKRDKRKIIIKVKGQKGASYQYQYATSKKFKKSKSIRSEYSSTTTMRRLAKKKKYYVRVRGYVTYDGKNYYGAWSKVKTIRTKK